MGKVFEGRTGNGDVSEAIRQAVSAASKERGPGGFTWELVSIDGSHGIIPFEVGVKITLTNS
jgi:hypothetical protein